MNDIQTFNQNDMFGFTRFSEKYDLCVKSEQTGISIVEDDFIVIGIYIQNHK